MHIWRFQTGDPIPKIVFLLSDEASVNSGKHSGLIRLIQEEFPWVSFIWCFSIRFELALRDSLKSFIDPVDESLLPLFYLYKNSSKKVWELKNLYHILKEQFQAYGNDIRPVKSTGTRWIDHRIRAMEKLATKFGLYIADTTKQLDHAKLQGKFNNLIESKVILRASSLLDILAEAKIFSLCTQKANTNIIDITDAAQSTQCLYNWLKKKLDEEPEFVFKLPT